MAIAALVAIGGTAHWLHRHRAHESQHQVTPVTEGVLYRSGQPEGAGLTDLRDRYHIRTVINLREDNPEAPWQKAETEFCRASGIQWVSLALGPEGFTEPQLARFLELAGDPASRPVLVHCEHGRNRTGYAVAAYRIRVEHWTFDAAVAEAREFGFPQSSHAYKESLRALAAGQSLAATPPAAAAKTDR